MQLGDFTIMPVDLFFTVVILFMTIKAIVRGFITEFMGLAGIGAGIILGAFFSPMLAEFISRNFGHSNWNQIIAFLVIFLIAYILIKIFENGLNALVDKIHLDKLDRSLGLFFGIVEGLAVVIIIVFVIEVQPIFNTEKLENESWYFQMIHKVLPDGGKIIEDTLEA